MTYTLSETEKELFDKFTEALFLLYHKKEDDSFNPPIYLKFYPTSINRVVHVGCEKYNTEIDITDYDLW